MMDRRIDLLVENGLAFVQGATYDRTFEVLGTNQKVTVNGSPASGTFELIFRGERTAGIAYNGTATAVQNAFAALPSIGAGKWTWSGSAGGPWIGVPGTSWQAIRGYQPVSDLVVADWSNLASPGTISVDYVPIDYTGYTARMHLRRDREDTSTVLELTTANGRIILGDTAGTIRLLVAASVTVDLPALPGWYDLELISGTTVENRAWGRYEVRREVTR